MGTTENGNKQLSACLSQQVNSQAQIYNFVARTERRLESLQDFEDKAEALLFGGTGDFGLLKEVKQLRSEIETLKKELDEKAAQEASIQFEKWKLDQSNKVVIWVAVFTVLASCAGFFAERFLTKIDALKEQQQNQSIKSIKG